MLYGVARISTRKQSIDRQVRNITEKYPTAKMIKETYTGTKLEGRKEFEKLLKIIQNGYKDLLILLVFFLQLQLIWILLLYMRIILKLLG